MTGTLAGRPERSLDLEKFALADMLRCGLDLRRVAKGAPNLEQAAQRIVRYFYERCWDTDTGERSCALVRCYKSHPFERLEPDLQSFARSKLGAEPVKRGMKCLTLLATAGDEPAWNSRHESQGHRAIPLPSAQIVEQAPMIAQLFKQFGLDISEMIQASTEVVRDAAGRSYNIFHVEHAEGSAFIPAQAEFVIRYRIRSVLGFGGSLQTGDMFAIILFSKVPIPRQSADRFRTVALDAKSALFFFGEGQVFDGDAASAR